MLSEKIVPASFPPLHAKQASERTGSSLLGWKACGIRRYNYYVESTTTFACCCPAIRRYLAENGDQKWTGGVWPRPPLSAQTTVLRTGHHLPNVQVFCHERNLLWLLPCAERVTNTRSIGRSMRAICCMYVCNAIVTQNQGRGGGESSGTDRRKRSFRKPPAAPSELELGSQADLSVGRSLPRSLETLLPSAVKHPRVIAPTYTARLDAFKKLYVRESVRN